MTSPKVKDRSLKMADLNQYVQDEIAKAGPPGPKGDTGARGATGLLELLDLLDLLDVLDLLDRLDRLVPPASSPRRHTSRHPTLRMAAPTSWTSTPSPLNASNDGRTPMLTFTLDAGKYYMSASAQFFHLGGPAGEDYGVFGTLMNGVIQPGNSVSPNIPGHRAQPAQTTAGGIFIVPANNTQITVVGSIRGTVGGPRRSGGRGPEDRLVGSIHLEHHRD